MIGKMETPLGYINISTEALAKMAGQIAVNCYGVVGMVFRNKADGIVSLLKRDKMTKGIKIEESVEGITVSMHIMVEYGVNIGAASENIISNVKYQLKKYTGLNIYDVKIFVESVRVD